MLYTYFQMNSGFKQTHSYARQGFTIVELLIVVVVIAILAAITIVSYNGITARARDTTLQSDLHNATNLMGIDYAASNSYATTLAAVNGSKGIPASDGTVYSFHSDGTSFCITGTSTYSGKSYYVSNVLGSPTLGKCPQDLGAVVATAAGNGTVGAGVGPGSSATMASPAGIAADGSGNLFFVDGQTSRVRKITTAGVVSNLAGNGPTGTTEGVGSAALFNWPQAVTVGPGNVLYVADSMNHRIRVLPLDGTTSTSTLAGSTQGNVHTINASGSSLKFNTPRGIVYNPVSNLIYLADSQNNQILQLDTTGKLLAVIGQGTGAYLDGSSSTAKFNYPQGLAVDSAGNVYVADTKNHAIRKINSSGTVSTIAGLGTTSGNTDGNGTSARFYDPMALVVASDGSIYVADTDNNIIRKITLSGDVTTIAGSGTAGYQEGTGTAAQFNAPRGIAIGSDGKLYVTDYGNNRIRVVSI